MVNTVIENSVSHDSDAKTHALIAYFLMVLGLFTAIPILIGAIWAMVKKKDARGSIYHSHYVNATRTFWWSLFWTAIGCVFLVTGIGIVVFAITWVWVLYRLLKGLARIISDEAYSF